MKKRKSPGKHKHSHKRHKHHLFSHIFKDKDHESAASEEEFDEEDEAFRNILEKLEKIEE